MAREQTTEAMEWLISALVANRGSPNQGTQRVGCPASKSEIRYHSWTGGEGCIGAALKVVNPWS